MRNECGHPFDSAHASFFLDVLGLATVNCDLDVSSTFVSHHYWLVDFCNSSYWRPARSALVL